MTGTEPAITTGRAHPVARAFGWVFGTLAALLSIFFMFLVATVISEWSGYVGHESGTATAIVAFFAVLTLGAWTATAIAFLAARRDR